jgi:hemoglobin
MNDIETFENIRFLIKRFYDKLLLDAQIGHFFQSLDLDTHLPRVADFWAFILIDQPGYTGNMMLAHAHLDLSEKDFEQWLYLFHETIDGYFKGPKANLAKERSSLIAWTMKAKR